MKDTETLLKTPGLQSLARLLHRSFNAIDFGESDPFDASYEINAKAYLRSELDSYKFNTLKAAARLLGGTPDLSRRLLISQVILLFIAAVPKKWDDRKGKFSEYVNAPLGLLGKGQYS